MKLWAVFYLAGKIASTVGPIPPDVTMTECRARVDAILDKGNQWARIIFNVTGECEYHDTRPPLDPSLPE